MLDINFTQKEKEILKELVQLVKESTYDSKSGFYSHSKRRSYLGFCSVLGDVFANRKLIGSDHIESYTILKIKLFSICKFQHPSISYGDYWFFTTAQGLNARKKFMNYIEVNYLQHDKARSY